VTDILESYDTRRNVWERHAPLPVALSGYALVAFEGKLYLFGGWDGAHVLASAYEYNPDANTWRVRSPMPTARANAAGVGAGGKIYVFGGNDGENPLSVNEEYIPDRDTWSASKPLPAARYGMAATSIADLVYLVGGIGKRGSSLPPMQYSYQLDQWQALEDSSSTQSWSYLGLVPLQTRLYAVGGLWNGLPTARNLSSQAFYSIFIPVSP
jgi:N-acetylneuraminic acid mutarotase